MGAELALHFGSRWRPSRLGTGAGSREQQTDLRKQRDEANRTDRRVHRVLERECIGINAAEALRVAQAKDVRNLDTACAARQAELEKELIVRHQANGEKRLVRGDTALLLDAQTLVHALAANQDVVSVDLREAAQESVAHSLNHDECFRDGEMR